MFRRLLLTVLLAAPSLSAADKTADKMLELLREVGGLQDQIRALQKSLEGKLGEVSQTNAEQARAAAEQVTKSVAALGDRIQKGQSDQQDQQSKTLAAVAGLGSQLQGISSDISTMRQAMTDLTTAMSKLSTQVGDLNTAVKALQAAKPETSSEPPRVELSASDLWAAAEGDRSGGKLDLALTEYTEFVGRFSDSGQAADALYYIGTIHYSRQEWDEAVKSFDQLLQTYAGNKRVPEALYYKGDALNRAGHWPEANETLKLLRKNYPNSPLAKQSLTIKPAAH